MTPVQVSGRAERLLAALDERGLDQMIVSDRSNIRWLSGFSGSAGVLIVSARGHVLISDGRYTDQARDQLKRRERLTWRWSRRAPWLTGTMLCLFRLVGDLLAPKRL